MHHPNDITKEITICGMLVCAYVLVHMFLALFGGSK